MAGRQYNNAGWFVLVSLDKLLEANNELKTSIGDLKSSGWEDKLVEGKELQNPTLQLQTCIRQFKVSQCVLKENLSFGYKPEIAETQTHALIIQMTELQCQFNAQPQST